MSDQPPILSNVRDPKPGLGRIVIYHFHDSELKDNNQGSKAPAMIVRVWSDDIVNLRVLNDGVAVEWKTSVVKGEGPGEWSWPERV